VRLLLQNSDRVQIKSIFVKSSILGLSQQVSDLSTVQQQQQPLVVNDILDALTKSSAFPVLVGSERVMSATAGFRIARGCLACGVVPATSETALLEQLKMQQQSTKRARLLALDGISDTANLGSVIRTASACGVDAVVLSANACDAWYRRAVRVSMGHVFRVPVVRVENLVRTLEVLNALLSVKSYAAVIDSDVEVLRLHAVKPGTFPSPSCALLFVGSYSYLIYDSFCVKTGSIPSSWCLVVGNEGNGISEAVTAACSYRIRIDMAQGVDSMSIPVATGILLNGLVEREKVDMKS
jgi:tRNA G18 (ribose-2'-O)-methylase SpoU